MLQSPPSEKHLSRMYYELSQQGAHCSGEKFPWPYSLKDPEEIFTLGAEMSRYDPRLLGILVEHLCHSWEIFSPQKIRSFYPKMKTPQTVAVIAEFGKSASEDSEARYFMDYLQRGLKPVPTQLYFKNIYRPGGKLSERAMESSLTQYKKWGFLAREFPTLDVFKKKVIGQMDQDSRLNILRRLLKENESIQLKDYLLAIRHSVTRQQALKDLKSAATLSKKSHGRGACWSLR